MDHPAADNSSIVPGHRVRVGKERARVGLCGLDDKKEPKIILIRDGDAVQAIEVVCTCGQKIRLNCGF